MSESKEMMSLSALLGASLDDLPDMPAFVTWPDGAYRCSVTCEMKEVLELADSSATPPSPGDTNSELFFLNKEIGISKLKEFLIPFGKKFGESQVQVLLDMIKNIEVDVVNKARKDKEDKTKRYFSSIAIEVV